MGSSRRDRSRDRRRRSRSRSQDQDRRRRRRSRSGSGRRSEERHRPDRSDHRRHQRDRPGDTFSHSHSDNHQSHDRGRGDARTGFPADLNDFWSHRREEREKIAESGISSIWGSSPVAEPLKSRLTEKDKTADHETKKHKKSKKKKHHDSGDDVSKEKKHKKKDKKKKKEKKRKRRSSSSSSSHSKASESNLDVSQIDETLLDAEERQFLKELRDRQKQRKQSSGSESDDSQYGPLPKSAVQLQVKDYGKALLPGEGAAMAAFIAEGKRIPRRGEIGLTPDEIVKFEDVGYVMSGSRHRRMEAVRMRKENQLYSADEKRALQMFNKEERSKRESKILNQFRDMVRAKQQQRQKTTAHDADTK